LQAVFSGISRRKLLDPGKNAGVNNDMNCVTPKSFITFPKRVVDESNQSSNTADPLFNLSVNPAN
jgi:hypothetical protein